MSIEPMTELKCYSGDEPRIPVTDEFIARNRLKIDTEAAYKIIKTKTTLFAFAKEVALDYLPFEEVKDLYTEEAKEAFEKGDKSWHVVTDVREAAQDFLDYMVFAWMKANDERGISASRSIEKLSAWMKILSRPDVAEILEDESLYPMYGKPALRKACEVLGITEVPNYIK